jgi:tetratricopeptide (TPR) repeat protein
MKAFPKGAHSSVLYDYLRKYQEDPTSRVFAPLAEAYRKAGLTKEAVEIAREGLRVHPQFVGGRVALARALFDLKQYEDVLLELRQVCRDVPDNLVAQRLVAESALILGRAEESLEAYKMLLYFSPADADAARMVQELEVQAYQEAPRKLQKDAEIDVPFETRNAAELLGADPGLRRERWMQKIERLQGLLQKVERYRHQH